MSELTHVAIELGSAAPGLMCTATGPVAAVEMGTT
jgi:hypothetical protein